MDFTIKPIMTWLFGDSIQLLRLLRVFRMLREDFQDTVTEMSLTIIFVTILVVTVVFIQVKSKTRIFRVAKVSRHNENIRILIRFEFRIEPGLFGREPSIYQRGQRLNISGLAVRGCLDWIIRVHGRFWPRFWFISTWNFQGIFQDDNVINGRNCFSYFAALTFYPNF